MYIAYSRKKDAEYARICESRWINGTSRQITLFNLGRVIDKNKGIYRSRQRGLFTYCLKTNQFGLPKSAEETMDSNAKQRS